MGRKFAFRPTAIDVLEDRVVLSHVKVVPVANVPVSVRLTGHSLAILPPAGVAGADSQLNLFGTRTGKAHVAGTIQENASLAPPFDQQSHGTIVLSTRSGTLTLSVNSTNFDFTHSTKTPVALNFTVVSATGSYASAIGSTQPTGTGTLALHFVRPQKPNVPEPIGSPLPAQPTFPGQFALNLRYTPTTTVD